MQIIKDSHGYLGASNLASPLIYGVYKHSLSAIWMEASLTFSALNHRGAAADPSETLNLKEPISCRGKIILNDLPDCVNTGKSA